jgi:hypothetical protein
VLVAYARSKGSLDLPDSFLEETLQHHDSTLRYCGCYTAAECRKVEYINMINELADDTAQPSWYWEYVGSTVKEAARYALAKLNPRSKVWQKPFQESFIKE